MDLTDDKFKKSNSDKRRDSDVASTTFKRNIFGRQKTCMYTPCCFLNVF